MLSLSYAVEFHQSGVVGRSGSCAQSPILKGYVTKSKHGNEERVYPDEWKFDIDKSIENEDSPLYTKSESDPHF
ncbi:hypothetical protein [Oceanobacillus jeddahense]|uniref:hypothetical protein n=1 Tax=Oceanobacillus jeddahense TaxID=1462527 RepID=UPI000595A728|nr:hypothetical protein [Oceanobacillus jeddahense]